MDKFVFVQWPQLYSVAIPCLSISFPREYQSLPLPIKRYLGSKFNNSQEYVKSLMSKLEAEYGVYFIPPSTYSGDLYG